MTETCNYCRGREARLELAAMLESGTWIQSPDRERPNLRDGENSWSVTGAATDGLTPSVWVNHGGEWHRYPAETLSELPFLAEIRRIPHVLEPDPEQLATMENRAGDGDSANCPEDLLEVLGIYPENGVIPDRIELREPRGGLFLLDHLEFGQAARLLRDDPELLGTCRCGEGEE